MWAQRGKMITIDAGRSSDSSFQLVNLNGKTTVDGSSPATGPDGITPVVGREADSWSYDVVLLLSKDKALYTYTTTPGKCDYMARVDLKSLSEKVVNDWSERDQHVNNTGDAVPQISGLSALANRVRKH